MISGFLGYNCNWAMVQRYHSVADERGAQKMALLCAGLSLMGPLLWILPVMAARVIFPDMHALWPTLTAPEEASFVSLALLLLPHGMLGFVVSAILSAALGQANDIFNWLSATVTHDLYVPWRRWRTGRAPTDKQQMRTAHLSMVIMGACGVAVAFYIPSFGGVFKFAAYYYSLMTTFCDAGGARHGLPAHALVVGDRVVLRLDRRHHRGDGSPRLGGWLGGQLCGQRAARDRGHFHGFAPCRPCGIAPTTRAAPARAGSMPT